MCRENYLAGSVPPRAHRGARRQSDFAGLGVRFDHRHTERSQPRSGRGFTWENMSSQVHFDCPVKHSGMAQFPANGIGARVSCDETPAK